jgi:hypothetical protein
MKPKTAEEEKPLITKEEFKCIFDALFNNFQRALSLSDSGDDAMSTPEIMEILREINPFVETSSVVKELQVNGYQYQFDLKDRQFKWLIKYKTKEF